MIYLMLLGHIGLYFVWGYSDKIAPIVAYSCKELHSINILSSATFQLSPLAKQSVQFTHQTIKTVVSILTKLFVLKVLLNHT